MLKVVVSRTSCARLLIPYKIYGGLSFYQRKEIKDIIAYFRLVANPNDEEAFKRIINYPARGIGNTTLQKIIDCANENEASLWDVVGDVQHYGLDVNKGTAAKLTDFVELINDFIRRLAMSDAYTLGSEIIKRKRYFCRFGTGNNARRRVATRKLGGTSCRNTSICGGQKGGRT